MYSLNIDVLLSVLDKPSPEAHLQVFHLAICHHQDEAVVKRLTKHICEVQPEFATAEVFKEIVLGMTYQSLRVFRCDSYILKSLPLTSILPLIDSGPDEGRARSGRPNSFVDDFWKSPLPTLRIAVPRFNFEIPQSPGGPAVLSSPGTPPSKRKFDGFLGRFFGPSPSEREFSLTFSLRKFYSCPSSPPPTNAFSEAPIRSKSSVMEEDDSSLQRAKFVEAMAEFITQSFPRETRKVTQEWVERYVARLAAQISALWVEIDNSRSVVINSDRQEDRRAKDPSHFALFQLLERFYCAIEELNFPLPEGFHTKFAVLGFHCLQRQSASPQASSSSSSSSGRLTD